MDLAQEFEKHAADCELMAKLTRDGESKSQWRELAQRFRQCANRAAVPPANGVPPSRLNAQRSSPRRSQPSLHC